VYLASNTLQSKKILNVLFLCPHFVWFSSVFFSLSSLIYFNTLQSYECLYRNYLPLHNASGLLQKICPDALTPPSGSYSHLLSLFSLGTGISTLFNVNVAPMFDVTPLITSSTDENAYLCLFACCRYRLRIRFQCVLLGALRHAGRWNQREATAQPSHVSHSLRHERERSGNPPPRTFCVTRRCDVRERLRHYGLKHKPSCVCQPPVIGPVLIFSYSVNTTSLCAINIISVCYEKNSMR
jgi:hypothetical protein